MSLPPLGWDRSYFCGVLVWLGIFFGPWLLIGAVVVGVLFAFGVLP